MSEPARIPIESCELCVTLPQLAEANHKLDEKRPPRLRELEDVCSWTGDDESGEGRIDTAIRRCRRCGTLYLDESVEDYDKGFLEAWRDEASIRRLTAVEALEALAMHEWQHGDAIAVREQLLAVRSSTAGELRTLVVEGRSPNVEVTAYAVACVLDHALESGDRDVIDGVLLRATDPMARLECVSRLRELALETHTRRGTPAIRARAKELLEEEEAGTRLAATLVSVMRESRTDGGDGRSKRSTHDAAARVLGGLLVARKPFDGEVLALTLGLLLDDDDAIAGAGAAALFFARWVVFMTLPEAVSDAFAAWRQKHPENDHARKLAPDFAKR